MKMKKRYVILLSTLALVIVAGIIFGIKYRYTVTELPQESLVINERCVLTEIKDKPRGRYSVTLPNTVIYIAEGIFENDRGLVSITFNEELTYIGKNAFKGCTALESVVLTGNIETVREYAFSGCSSLKKLEFTHNTWNVMEVGVFSDCTRLKSVRFAESETGVAAGMFLDCRALREVYLPDNVQAIGTSAFGNCDSLESIVFPASLEDLTIALYDCDKLERVEFEEGSRLQIIGDGALKNNPLLKEFVIPDGVLEVGGWCFEDCVSLEKVVIPSSVTVIGERLLQGCDSVTEVEMASPDGWCYYGDFGKTKQEEIPAEGLSDPQAAAEWFKAYLEVERSMKKDN